MQTHHGDIWEWKKAVTDGLHTWTPICVTTNGFVKNNGCAVMGVGIAKQALNKYGPGLAKQLGTHIKQHGNVLGVHWGLDLISFPVKHHWKDHADPQLIEKSCVALKELLNILPANVRILLPRPGCGNGKLSYHATIEPLLLTYFDDDQRVIVFHKEY